MAACLLKQSHMWNVICDGIPLSSFTRRVGQVFSSDVKASGDACQSRSPMMVAWGVVSALFPLTWKLLSFQHFCDDGTTIQTSRWTVGTPFKSTPLRSFLCLNDRIYYCALCLRVSKLLFVSIIIPTGFDTSLKAEACINPKPEQFVLACDGYNGNSCVLSGKNIPKVMRVFNHL